jgi:hypothetical protein
VRIAGLEMHPMDGGDRLNFLWGRGIDLQHHEVLHRGVSRGDYITDNDHPAKERRGSPLRFRGCSGTDSRQAEGDA